MSTPPDRPLDALGLARNGTVVACEYPMAGFARVRDRLAEARGAVETRAEFRLQGGLPTAMLRVRAEVVLVCQRCLGPLARNLESQAQLAFVAEETPELPQEYEAIGGDPERVDLAALVEDELLLSLPLIPQHAPGESCALPAEAAVATEETQAEKMRRPFAGLKDLMKH